MCRTITGLPAKSVKKILEKQPQDKKRIINGGIVRFRDAEMKEHQAFLEYLKE
jgi:hypothetical protein